MKKLILTLTFFVAVVSPIQMMAKEFYVEAKINAQDTLNIMREKKITVIDVVPLDNAQFGYVKIIYER